MYRQKKGQLKITGLNYNLKFFKSYLAWIANLGVVPLFLLAAFLLAPALFFLAALLFDVTLVLETMIKLLSQKLLNIFKFFKMSYISIFGFSVKGFVIALGVTGQISMSANATSLTPTNNSGTQSETLLLSVGEMFELKLEKANKFHFAQKKLIQYRFDETKKLLRFKGLTIGQTDLIIKEEGKIRKITIIISSGLINQKFEMIIKKSQLYGFVTTIEDDRVSILGEIKNPQQYYSFSSFILKNENFVELKVKLEESLKNEILAEVFKQALIYNLTMIKCHFDEYWITCFYPKPYEGKLSSFKILSEKYGIKFIAQDESISNHKIKIKFIQIEKLDGTELNFGLSNIDSSLEEIMNLPLANIIGKNQVKLKENQVDLSTLAEPELEIIPGVESTFSLGNETPFTTTDKNQNQHTTWHFSGLKVKVKLNTYLDQYLLEYDSELTKLNLDTNQSTSGSKGKASVLIQENNPIKVFEINLKTNAIGIEQFPVLGKIPILGEMFKSKSTTNNFKKIYAIVGIY